MWHDCWMRVKACTHFVQAAAVGWFFAAVAAAVMLHATRSISRFM